MKYDIKILAPSVSEVSEMSSAGQSDWTILLLFYFPPKLPVFRQYWPAFSFLSEPKWLMTSCCLVFSLHLLVPVLQLRLQQRRTREQLVDQGIMPCEDTSYPSRPTCQLVTSYLSDLSYPTYLILPVTCYLSHPTCHNCHTCHILPISSHLSHLSHRTCHILPVTSYLSRHTCHTCHILPATSYLSHLSHLSHPTCHTCHILPVTS